MTTYTPAVHRDHMTAYTPAVHRQHLSAYTPAVHREHMSAYTPAVHRLVFTSSVCECAFFYTILFTVYCGGAVLILHIYGASKTGNTF